MLYWLLSPIPQVEHSPPPRRDSVALSDCELPPSPVIIMDPLPMGEASRGTSQNIVTFYPHLRIPFVTVDDSIPIRATVTVSGVPPPTHTFALLDTLKTKCIYAYSYYTDVPPRWRTKTTTTEFSPSSFVCPTEGHGPTATARVHWR